MVLPGRPAGQSRAGFDIYHGPMTDGADIFDIVFRASKPLFASDFDGTLSEIVGKPEDARPVPGAIEALEALVSVGVEVAVVSGRPISFLDRIIPPSLDAVLIGQSGLETSRRGVYTAHPDLEAAMPALEAALVEARSKANGMEVELKGFSFTIHYRSNPELADAAHQLADELAVDHGLAVVPGKMSVELRVPVDVDKGLAVKSLIGDHDLVMFAGDDIVDVSAFLELKSLAGPPSLSFGISGPETPDAVSEAADMTLGSPSELVNVLQDLAQGRRDRLGTSL